MTIIEWQTGQDFSVKIGHHEPLIGCTCVLDHHEAPSLSRPSDVQTKNLDGVSRRPCEKSTSLASGRSTPSEAPTLILIFFSYPSKKKILAVSARIFTSPRAVSLLKCRIIARSGKKTVVRPRHGVVLNTDPPVKDGE